MGSLSNQSTHLGVLPDAILSIRGYIGPPGGGEQVAVLYYLSLSPEVKYAFRVYVVRIVKIMADYSHSFTIRLRSVFRWLTELPSHPSRTV